MWFNRMLELKMAVLKAAGIEHLRPAHCKLLAELMLEATHKRISITTLKRVYGFAASQTKASLYTIRILEEFSRTHKKLVNL
jgi:hypothetical protein